jgi:hypothetical protein
VVAVWHLPPSSFDDRAPSFFYDDVNSLKRADIFNDGVFAPPGPREFRQVNADRAGAIPAAVSKYQPMQEAMGAPRDSTDICEVVGVVHQRTGF